MNTTQNMILESLPNIFTVTLQDDMLVFKMEDGRVNKMTLFPFQLQILKDLYKSEYT